MGIGSGIAIYFVIWWVTLFMVLPIGVRSQREAGTVVPGSEPGAPMLARLPMKLALNTLLAGAVFGMLVLARANGVGLDSLPLPTPPSLR